MRVPYHFHTADEGMQNQQMELDTPEFVAVQCIKIGLRAASMCPSFQIKEADREAQKELEKPEFTAERNPNAIKYIGNKVVSKNQAAAHSTIHDRNLNVLACYEIAC